MKALFVSPAAAVYGSERSMLTLLNSRNFDAEVVCPPGGNLERELLELDVKVHPLEFGRYSLRQNPAWHLGFLLRFRQILQASEPDVVVINLDGNTPLVTLIAVWAGIPIIRFSRFEFFPPKRFIDRWCWKKAGAVICPSEWVRQQVLNWGGASYSPRTHRLYDAFFGCNASTVTKADLTIEPDLNEEIIIGCIGRLHRGKRFETAIESVALIRNSGKNARLLIIGGDDGSSQARDYLEELIQLADKLGVGNAVTFMGHLPHAQVSGAFSLMNVFVLPSESESFGMVLMEAWAHGVPTICSDIGGCSEITRASGGGLLAPVGDARQFAAHALHLLAHPDEATSMGHKGMDWVSENCDPASYAARFESILNDTTHQGQV